MTVELASPSPGLLHESKHLPLARGVIREMVVRGHQPTSGTKRSPLLDEPPPTNELPHPLAPRRTPKLCVRCTSNARFPGRQPQLPRAGRADACLTRRELHLPRSSHFAGCQLQLPNSCAIRYQSGIPPTATRIHPAAIIHSKPVIVILVDDVHHDGSKPGAIVPLARRNTLGM